MATSRRVAGNPSQLDMAYAAGFYDGEGSVVFMARPAPRGRVNYKVASAVMNTDRPILEWLQAQFFGNIYKHGFKAKPATWRPGWQWLLNDAEDLAFFWRGIRPFLRIKGALVDNALAALELKHRTRRGYRTAPDLYVRLAELQAIHQALGTRGRIDPIVVPELNEIPQMELLHG